MSARFLILLALAGGLAVFWAVRPATAPDDGITSNHPVPFDADPDLVDKQLSLWQRPLPGEEPDPPPEFTVNVSVDLSAGKNRLIFEVTEIHGYYAEYLTFFFWYHKPGEVLDDPANQSLFRTQHVANKYIKAGEVLRESIEIVPAEIDQAGGDMGSGENWSATVSCVRARAKNPDPLPFTPEFGKDR